MAEWLRRWTRNPLGSPRTGSNPVGDEVFFIPFVYWLTLGEWQQGVLWLLGRGGGMTTGCTLMSYVRNTGGCTMISCGGMTTICTLAYSGRMTTGCTLASWEGAGGGGDHGRIYYDMCSQRFVRRWRQGVLWLFCWGGGRGILRLSVEWYDGKVYSLLVEAEDGMVCECRSRGTMYHVFIYWTGKPYLCVYIQLRFRHACHETFSLYTYSINPWCDHLLVTTYSTMVSWRELISDRLCITIALCGVACVCVCVCVKLVSSDGSRHSIWGAWNETECQVNCREFWRAKINI